MPKLFFVELFFSFSLSKFIPFIVPIIIITITIEMLTNKVLYKDIFKCFERKYEKEPATNMGIKIPLINAINVSKKWFCKSTKNHEPFLTIIKTAAPVTAKPITFII